MESYPPFSASVSAVTGSSRAPGTQKTSGSSTPCCSRASSAPRSSRFEMSSLKRDTTTARLSSAPSSSGAAPFSPITRASQEVAQLVFLGFQVALVVRVGRNLDRDSLDHLEPESLQAVDLL